MSHIATIKTEIRDEQAVRSACQRLKLAEPTFGTFQLFAVQRTGLGVQLPDWRYPVVIDLNTGSTEFDNYNEEPTQQSIDF